jgi:hypothetical protein
MDTIRPLPCVYLTFVLIILSFISTSEGSPIQVPFLDQARAASENELELNCEGNENLCLVEACLGSECTPIGKELGILQMFSGEILYGNDPMRIGSKNNCQTNNEKEEISNFNFRATSEEPDEINSFNNLAKSNQIPAAWWDHSGSDILIGMDLGMIKKICNLDVKFNENAEIENGFSVKVSNDTKSFHKVVSEFTSGSLSNSRSTYDLDNLAGRFIQLTIPGISEFFVGNDDDDPVVSEIKVKALPLTQISRNSSSQSNSSDSIARQLPNNTIAQLELSPLQFLDSGSDLLNIPTLGPDQRMTNQSSLITMSSVPTPNIYTGDIFLP